MTPGSPGTGETLRLSRKPASTGARVTALLIGAAVLLVVLMAGGTYALAPVVRTIVAPRGTIPAVATSRLEQTPTPPAQTPRPTTGPATPTKPAVPTIILGSPTPFPTSDVVGGAVVVHQYEFDGTSLADWQPGGGIDAVVKDGALLLTGQYSWNGFLSLNAGLKEGQAALFLFEYEPLTELQMGINTGQWNQASWRTWGIEGSPEHGFVPVTGEGTSGGPEPQPNVNGSLIPAASRWYFLLFKVGGAQEFVTRIWERDNPSSSLEMRQAMPPTWTGLSWDVTLDVYAGKLIVDRFQQLDFGGSSR